MDNSFNQISIKDRLIDIWYRYKKYIILSVCLILALIITAILLSPKSKQNNYSDIERIMILNAQNYVKNNNIEGNTYVSLNNLNIKIDEKLKCNNLSGVYKESNSYYVYLVCENYKSQMINDIIESNKEALTYGELNGDALYFILNGKYQEAGVKTDYQVNIKGNDIDNGLNIVTYYINDNGKYVGELKRIVIVEELEGIYPTLTLVGEKTKSIPQGSKYSDQGYKAIDSKDGNITDKVKVTGSVDTTKVGTYKITYSVTNSRGKTSTETRTIIVNESGNIDLDMSYTLNPSTVTKKSVTITVSIKGSGYKHTILPDNSENTSSTVNYTVYKNGTYDFIVYDKNSNSEVYSVTVKNIKNDPPSGECAVTYENEKSTLKINANDKELIESYEIYNDNKFLIKQKSDSYTFNDYPIETKVKMTDIISQSTTISCKVVDKDPKYFTAGGFKKSNKDLNYWLYVPKDANIHEKLPLIIFMHGSGEGGSIDAVARHGLPKYIKEGTMDSLNIKAFIIAPQLSSWRSDSTHKKIINLINEMKNEYNIDETRVSLFGFSAGGVGGSDFVANYPEVFAAFVPIAGANEDGDVSRAINIPIRGYAGTKDSWGTTKTEKYVNKINSMGGNATFTPIEGKGHVCTDDVFLSTDVLKWAISQKKGVK